MIEEKTQNGKCNARERYHDYKQNNYLAVYSVRRSKIIIIQDKVMTNQELENDLSKESRRD